MYVDYDFDKKIINSNSTGEHKMAVNSLSKMSVPVASDQSAPGGALLMPKLKYRFRIIFENFGVSTPTTELTRQVMDFRRPAVAFEDIVIPVYNSNIKLAGRASWGEVTCNLRDTADGSIQKLVGEQVQKQMDFLEMASASSGIDYKFLTKCEILDGGNGASGPVVLETWELYGCYLKQVDYGEIAYSSNEPVTIGLTILFDNAAQLPEGVGKSVIVRTFGDLVAGVGTVAGGTSTVPAAA